MSVIGYDLISDISDLSIKHFFISSGERIIVKAIEYRFISQLGNRRIFNLAFGDYIIEEDGRIDDTTDSNNGDAYKVFNTVLTTIPNFFVSFPNDIIMVTGSDSTQEYIENCKENCKKHCTEDIPCKNKDRRISIYMKHVSRNYDALMSEYSFYGGVKNENNIQILPYISDNKYDAVFVIKK